MLSLAHLGPLHNSLHNPAAWLFTLVLVLLFPVLDYVLYFQLKSTLQIYLWNILALWTLALACLWILRRNGLSLTDIGMSLGNRPWSLGISVALLVLLALSARSREKQSSKSSDAKLAALVNRIRRLLRATSTEPSLWVLGSLTAGLCEEFLHRGWLLAFFSAALGFVWAGLLHQRPTRAKSRPRAAPAIPTLRKRPPSDPVRSGLVARTSVCARLCGRRRLRAPVGGVDRPPSSSWLLQDQGCSPHLGSRSHKRLRIANGSRA
jgi:membrane protease YdiL (CAAX protease family)